MDPATRSALATVVMFAVAALAFGGVQLLRQGNKQKGWLMIGCAVVVLGNLVIWTI